MIFFNKFIEKIKNMDTKIKKILHKGFIFSFILCIFSTILLFTYENFYKSPNLFYIGLSLFKSSLIFISALIMCAIGFDTIKKQIA